MPVTYALYENQLTTDPNDYLAMVKPVGTAGLEDVITRMLQQGSTVSKSDTRAVLEEFFSAIEALLAQGMNVNTDLVNFSMSLKGTFQGFNDSYDSSRHQLLPQTSPGRRLRASLRQNGQVVKGEAGRPVPVPVSFNDVQTGASNSIVTAGGMAQVGGHRLKYDPSDAEQGIFFVGSEGAAHRVSVVGLNKPGSLMFTTPALPAGEYTLQIRARAAGSESLRVGTLEAALMVA